ncbi:hypothetical protein BATDEDRAFT_90934 [Batrachochytrium dendrobatidis JAM81]|uniref:Fanconi-associated nuclease n=1 Tax=Batrachochytrium dendrobatidis (strain JAM81 / FGSC 10211) TaxID=684364 RepID=F4P980_BATDJ|nr:uncharacterized protein BATDEDRAFT_90934 [Batrachochytrium dendrobatidis JAM81]EGF78296.1 hypothetical protein BATDEDRAFT_90934 [Batrachochytrium dendrobatidis JAM81]|eukprot:XP_006681269.1 hypothetical protein BATDEDRAFT_90934 [Batrachochytrium dendrobatidis JAM81]
MKRQASCNDSPSQEASQSKRLAQARLSFENTLVLPSADIQRFKSIDDQINTLPPSQLELTVEPTSDFTPEYSNSIQDGSVYGVYEESIEEDMDDLTTISQRSYSEQLQHMISNVLPEESHLLDDQHMSVLRWFDRLSEGSQIVMFRLLNRRTRKYVYINKIKLHEDEDINQILAELVNADYIVLDGPSTLEEWVDLLKKDQLVDLAKHHRVATSGKKLAVLRESFLATVNNQLNLDTFTKLGRISTLEKAHERLIKLIQEIVGPLLKVTELARSAFYRLFVIYNRTTMWPKHDSFLTNSILCNLSASNESKKSFAQYTVHRTSLVWSDKAEFELYFTSLKVEHEMAELIADKPAESQLVEFCNKAAILFDLWLLIIAEHPSHVTGIPWFMVFTHGKLPAVLTRIVASYASILIQLKKPHDAIQVLDGLLSQRILYQRRRGSWYDELVKLLERHLTPNYDLAHRSSILRRLCRISGSKQAGIPALWNIDSLRAVPSSRMSAYKLSNETGGKAIYLDENHTPMHVEELVLQHYAKQGWKGIHAENTAPLDLYTEYFFTARQESIETRIQAIKSGEFPLIIRQVVDKEQPRNTQCVGK